MSDLAAELRFRSFLAAACSKFRRGDKSKTLRQALVRGEMADEEEKEK
jgi:hypothetical protein